uniref:Uncharacterized protein n=1 Tax=Anguilla anguilla TaxID=7936 RepID=A0A0E9TZ09_ANGAN
MLIPEFPEFRFQF